MFFFATSKFVYSVKLSRLTLFKAANQAVLERAAGKYRTAAAVVRDKNDTVPLFG